MDAEQLRALARRAANRTGYRQILVLGSQAVHGALPSRDLPDITTVSEEVDLAVPNDLTGGTPHEIEAHFGMGSESVPDEVKQAAGRILNRLAAR